MSVNGFWVISEKEKRAYSTHEDFVTLINAQVGVTEEYLTSIISAQGDDLVGENLEIEALARVLFVSRPEKVVALSKEVPSMVGLDARQLGEFVLLGLAGVAERIKDDGRCEDGSDAKDAGDELVVLTGDGMKEGRIESRHEVERVGERRGEGSRRDISTPGG